MTDKRTTVLDAAIELLGTEGLRALTHRRVDSIADVPAGSTSNYFRTRQALVEGVLDRLLERDRVDVAALAGAASAAPRDERELEDLLCGYVLFATDSDTVRPGRASRCSSRPCPFRNFALRWRSDAAS